MLTFQGKGKKFRNLPVSEDLASELKARGHGHVFPGRSEHPMSPDYLAYLVNPLLPRGVTLHKLRHRFATKAYAVEHDLLTVQRLLGHSSPATTERYVMVGTTDMRNTVNAVTALTSSTS
jgi:integrase